MGAVIRRMALGACVVVVSGCASVTGGNVQKMYVQTQEKDGASVTGADCVLSNDKGSWKLTSPGDTSVVRSNKPMEVKCDKASSPQGVATVESATRAAMFGNLIVGGVVGAVIDHSSGAAYEYAEIVKVVMGDVVAIAAPKAAPSAGVDASRASVARVASNPGPGAAPAVPVTAQPHHGGGTSGMAQPSPQIPGLAAQPMVPVMASQASLSAPAPAPVARAQPQRQPVPRGSRGHNHPVPAPSGYAQAMNADAVPVRPEGKGRYAHYLTLPSPKAFVVYETGGWKFWFNSPNAMTNLLDDCVREGRKCWLYAVDNQVVWREDVQQRIGRSDQLGR